MTPRPLKITPTGSQKRRWVWAARQAGQRLTAWAAEALDDAAEVAAEEAGGFPFELPSGDSQGLTENQNTKP